MNIIKCIAEFFCSNDKEPLGLCAFERRGKSEQPARRRVKPKREMRLSELME